jgi:hypothetical protein
MAFIAALGALAGLYVLLRKDIHDVKQELRTDMQRAEDRQSTRFDAIDGRFDRVDDRFDRLEAKIDRVRGELIAHLQGGHPPAA